MWYIILFLQLSESKWETALFARVGFQCFRRCPLKDDKSFTTLTNELFSWYKPINQSLLGSWCKVVGRLSCRAVLIGQYSYSAATLLTWCAVRENYILLSTEPSNLQQDLSCTETFLTNLSSKLLIFFDYILITELSEEQASHNITILRYM